MSDHPFKRLLALFLCLILFTSSVSASVTIHFSDDETVTVRKKESVLREELPGQPVDETEDDTESDPNDSPAQTEAAEETAVDTDHGNVDDETEADTENSYEETEADIFMPAKTFTAKTGMVSVIVNAPEGAFPEGTLMSIKDVEDQETLSTIEENVNAHVSRIHAVDITFTDKEGRSIDPLLPVTVILTAEEKKEDEVALVIHVDDEGNTEEVPSLELTPEEAEKAAALAAKASEEEKKAETLADSSVLKNDSASASAIEAAADQDMKSGPDNEIETESKRRSLKSVRNTRKTMTAAPAEAEEEKTITESGECIQFEASLFSVYALVYTVDFHWEVNGKMYEFNLPGGGYVSFQNLIEVLGISQTTYGSGNQGENASDNDENEAVSSEDGDNESINLAEEVPVIIDQDETDENSSMALALDGVEVSDVTRKFVADVESVVFSSPELVDISKVESETTVGGIKESRGLEVQYSADLTEEQIAEINGMVVESGDWALISMLPFESEETLIVTMKNGDAFEIRVTDVQIKKTVIDARGDTWEITVTYNDEAEIPEDAELRLSAVPGKGRRGCRA